MLFIIFLSLTIQINYIFTLTFIYIFFLLYILLQQLFNLKTKQLIFKDNVFYIQRHSLFLKMNF